MSQSQYVEALLLSVADAPVKAFKKVLDVDPIYQQILEKAKDEQN